MNIYETALLPVALGEVFVIHASALAALWWQQDRLPALFSIAAQPLFGGGPLRIGGMAWSLAVSMGSLALAGAVIAAPQEASDVLLVAVLAVDVVWIGYLLWIYRGLNRGQRERLALPIRRVGN